MNFAHAPVMVREVLDLLRPQPRGRYLDGTLGGGGHSEQLLEHSSPGGEVLGLDRDEAAVTAARERLGRFGRRVTIRRENFSAAGKTIDELGWKTVDGVLLDLGVSSYQLQSQERGFGFRADARLDMRMDRRQSLDAYRIVNTFPAGELEHILRDYGEEPQARRIARELVARRATQPLETTGELARLVERVKGKGGRSHHPATQTFQALRIAVNQELEHLEYFLENGYELLNPQGRMVIISFQSLEDRRVKSAFRKWSRDCLCPPRTPACRCGWSRKARLLTKRPLGSSQAEIAVNPRARSAKLRAVERM